MPLFGDLIRKTAISRFSRTLGTLVTSGVPILQALNITRETAGNSVIANAISQVHDSVKEGESIVQPLEASGAFPPMVISMIDVGEETGQLPEMLLKIAEVYDDEVDNSVAALTSLLEPIMIVFLAVVVGTIVIALFMPLISIISGLQQQTSNVNANVEARPAIGASPSIELLIVMTIILVFAGLILATTGYVQKKGARSRAEAEIAAMSAALENYKADNGVYPSNLKTTEKRQTRIASPDPLMASQSRSLQGTDQWDRDIDASCRLRNAKSLLCTFKPISFNPATCANR